MDIKMNESLDLRNRILKMRESNNLVVTKKSSSNNDLMSKFESSIKDDNPKKSNPSKNIGNDKNEEKTSKSIKNKSENLIHHKNGTKQKTAKGIVNDNEAQFLMLANKFNEAVEVILELSQKVENLERNFDRNSPKTKKIKFERKEINPNVK